MVITKSFLLLDYPVQLKVSYSRFCLSYSNCSLFLFSVLWYGKYCHFPVERLGRWTVAIEKCLSVSTLELKGSTSL